VEADGTGRPGERRVGRDGRARLLLAEDDPVIARLYRIKLERDGFAVHVAADGPETVRKALAHPPDLLLLDLLLPALDGHGVLAQLREHEATRRVPVLVLSAHSEPRLMERSRRLGAVDHVVKGNTSPAMLSARICAVLDDVQPGWRQRSWTGRA
jgi:DNA-binding response OmpR family regulator